MSKRGFTFIELLVVLSVITILVSLVGGYFSSSLKRSRDQQRLNDIKQYQTALENYANNNDSLYPIFVNTVSAATAVCPNLGSLMSKCIEDPSFPNAGFVYNYQSSVDGFKWVLWAKVEATQSYWISCSNRKSGTKTATGFSVNLGNCPL